jgi:hypothetical protein
MRPDSNPFHAPESFPETDVAEQVLRNRVQRANKGNLSWASWIQSRI